MKRLPIVTLAAALLLGAQTIPPEPPQYTVYLPAVQVSNVKFGLAMPQNLYYPQDVTAVGAGWWYDWTASRLGEPGYVPMSWCGKVPAIPETYAGPLLVFNEPNISGQCNITPAEAYARYKVLSAALPHAVLIPGGVSIFALDWMKEFVRLLNTGEVPYPNYFHLHAYIEGKTFTFDYVRTNLPKFYELVKRPLWVTEYNVVGGNPALLRDLKNWLEKQPYVYKHAVFTNRASTDGWALPGTAIINSDGTLNASGQAIKSAYPSP